jgi:hypothetical protein
LPPDHPESSPQPVFLEPNISHRKTTFPPEVGYDPTGNPTNIHP